MTRPTMRKAARPTTLDGMRAAMQNLTTEAGRAKAAAFRPRPSDIIIAPHAKCGTTWMQQIVHGLRSGGAMDFTEITEAVPWIELAHDMGVDLEAEQAARPRAFKSHFAWDDVPKGARYIVVFRDPADVIVSFHRFLEGWAFETGSIALDDFAEGFISSDRWHRHAASWWRQRRRDDVLFFTYERMKRELPAVVEAVADFLDPATRRETRAIALRQASLDFMKRYGRQFDDHLVRAARDAACGLPEGGEASKLGRGLAGRGARLLSAPMRAKLDARWEATMGGEFGFADYAAFAAAVDALPPPSLKNPAKRAPDQPG
ncbi:MAG: sulfotransferase domain-containing protein [Pseudomonadota bacterium]